MGDRHPDYWRIKAAFFEARAVALEARAAVAQADATFQAVLRAAGFDPDVSYDLDDATESIVPRPPAAP